MSDTEEFTIIFVSKNETPNRKIFGGFLTKKQQDTIVAWAENFVDENAKRN